MSEEQRPFIWHVIPEEIRGKFAEVILKANPAQRQAIFDILTLEEAGLLSHMTDEELGGAVGKVMEDLK